MPHSDECRERFRKLLETDRLASAAKSAGIPVPPTPAPAPGDAFAAPRTPAVMGKPKVELESPEVFFAASHTDKDDPSPQGDYREFDQQHEAWKTVHIRPKNGFMLLWGIAHSIQLRFPRQGSQNGNAEVAHQFTKTIGKLTRIKEFHQRVGLVKFGFIP